MKEILAKALEASIANPLDEYEVDLIADAASVGITDPLSSTDRRVEWTENVLSAKASTLQNMPVNLRISEDGKFQNHTNTVIGRVAEAYFDKNRGKMVAKAKLWKHYFPETISALSDLMKDPDKRPEVSIEFMPTSMEAAAEDTDRPLDGRFIGLGIVDKGADRGNMIHLLASAKKEEEQMKREESRTSGAPLPGSFEWIGEQVLTSLTASAALPMNVIATYPDRMVWYSNSTYYQTPFTVTGTDIKIGDTIEVEQDFKPLSASAPEGKETPVIDEPKKEAEEPMAEISDTELQALKASAANAEELKKELDTLKAAVSDKDKELEDAKAKLAEAEKRDEEARLEKLAASRMDEVEKIQKYDDAEQKKADYETFKTLDDKAFELVKRALTASAANRGGVADDARITNPSREDADGEAAAIVQSEEFKKLLAAVNAEKEDK